MNKKMMTNMVKEYGKKKAPRVFNALENKMKKKAPEKAARMFGLEKPVFKGASLMGNSKGPKAPVKKAPLMQKVAKAVPKVMERLKGAMPAKLKDIKAKLKK